MESGRKRQRDELSDDEPATKRPKTNRSKSKSPSNQMKWPEKQPRLTDQQISELPSLTNPSMHKCVFESFCTKKGWGKPIFDCYQSDATTPTQRMFQTNLLLVHPNDDSLRISITSDDFDSKKKATVDAYYKFNINYIAIDILKKKMKPFSTSKRLVSGQVSIDCGSHLKDKTASVEIEPVPLQMHEGDVIKLLYTNQRDKTKVENHRLVKFIKFHRVSANSIYKKLFIQFDCNDTASTFVKFLNGKRYQKYTLRVNWKEDLNSKMYLKPTRYLKVVGFPMGLYHGDIRRYLGKQGVFCENVVLCTRYSMFLELFLEFDDSEETEKAFEIVNTLMFDGLKKRDGSFIKKVKARRLYARYALSKEYEEADDYENDVVAKSNEVTKSSNCVDVKGVTWDTKEAHLIKAFRKVGNVVRAKINPRKDLTPGTAFVQFQTDNEAVQAVLNMTGYVLNGRALKVTIHTKQTAEEKKVIKTWYVEREKDRRKAAREQEDNKKKTRRDKQRRKRIRRFGHCGRTASRQYAREQQTETHTAGQEQEMRPVQDQKTKDISEWG